MRKIVFAVVGSALLVASTAQIASAGTRHVKRAPQATEQLQNSNAYVRSFDEPRWSSNYPASYYTGGGAISAPAGR